MDNIISLKKNKFINLSLRALISLIGVILVSIGATFLKEGAVGLDPFTAVNIGLSKIFGIGLGSIQLGFNVIIFILVLLLDRHQIGIGTLLNMTLVGFGIQFFSQIYTTYFSGSLSIPLILFDAVFGLLVFTLGTSLYMEANLGVAPYDAIAPIIVKRTRLKYQWVRSVQDIGFMIAGFCVHGEIGFMTIIVAFFAGPLINFWNIKVSQGIFKHIKSFSQNQKRARRVGIGTMNAGRLGWSALRNAYFQTTIMERNMSTYSSKELTNAMHQTESQIHMNKIAYRNLHHRYNAIQKEMQERKE